MDQTNSSLQACAKEETFPKTDRQTRESLPQSEPYLLKPQKVAREVGGAAAREPHACKLPVPESNQSEARKRDHSSKKKTVLYKNRAINSYLGFSFPLRTVEPQRPTQPPLTAWCVQVLVQVTNDDSHSITTSQGSNDTDCTVKQI